MLFVLISIVGNQMENKIPSQLTTFKVEYQKANVKQGQSVWSKALLTSPMFSPSKNILKVELESDLENALVEAEKIKKVYDLKEVTFTKNAITIHYDKEDLKAIGSQYESVTYYGYPLNVTLHFTFLSYMVGILFDQLSAGYDSFTVSVDLNTMIRDLGLDSKSKAFYKGVLNDMNLRLAHSSARIVMKNGNVINDRYVYKFGHDESEDVFVTVFGDIFVESVMKDTWRQKVDYLEQSALKDGTPTYLFNYINMMARSSTVKGKLIREATISVNTVLKNITSDAQINDSSKRSKRKNAVDQLSDALNYLLSIEFITSVKDDKDGGRSVKFKNVVLNPDFKLSDLVDKSAVGKFKADSSVINVKPVIEAPVVRTDVDSAPVKAVIMVDADEALRSIENVQPTGKEAALARLEKDLLRIGVNAAVSEPKHDVETDWSSWTDGKWDIEPEEFTPESEEESSQDDSDGFFEPDEFDKKWSK